MMAKTVRCSWRPSKQRRLDLVGIGSCFFFQTASTAFTFTSLKCFFCVLNSNK